MIKFTIDMVPVAKGRPRFVRRGKFVSTYTPKKTAVAEKGLKSKAWKYIPKEIIKGPIRLSAKFYMPIPTGMRKAERDAAMSENLYHIKKPDKDNLEKLLKDALNGVFWVDDSQVCTGCISKVYSPNPRIEVEIEEINQFISKKDLT